MINEYYANIKGYEGLYQISNCGNVKSITHYRKNRYNKKQKFTLRNILNHGAWFMLH